MPFQPHGPTSLTVNLNVRLTPTEKQQLQEEANLAGISMSELVRRRYFGKPIIASADKTMISELRRIGGLLKHIHNQSGGAYSKTTSNILLQLQEYIVELKRDRKKN